MRHDHFPCAELLPFCHRLCVGQQRLFLLAGLRCLRGGDAAAQIDDGVGVRPMRLSQKVTIPTNSGRDLKWPSAAIRFFVRSAGLA